MIEKTTFVDLALAGHRTSPNTEPLFSADGSSEVEGPDRFLKNEYRPYVKETEDFDLSTNF
jgi:hypothetical protein